MRVGLLGIGVSRKTAEYPFGRVQKSYQTASLSSLFETFTRTSDHQESEQEKEREREKYGRRGRRMRMEERKPARKLEDETPTRMASKYGSREIPL